MDFIEEDVCKILEGLKECRVVEENDELDGDDLINVSKMGYLDTDEDWLMRSSIMDNTSSSSSSLLLTSSNLNNKDSNLISITRLLNESEKEYNLMNTSTILEDQASPDLVSLISSVHTTSEVIQQQGRHSQDKQGLGLVEGEKQRREFYELNQTNDDYFNNFKLAEMNENTSLGLLEAEECSFQYPSLNEHQLDNLLSLQQQQQQQLQQQNSSVNQQQIHALNFTSLQEEEHDLLSNHRGEGEDNKNSIIMFNSLEMNDDLLLNSDAAAISCSNNSSSSSSSLSYKINTKAQSTDNDFDDLTIISITFKEDELTRERERREDLDCTFKVKDDNHELNNQTFKLKTIKKEEAKNFNSIEMNNFSSPPHQVNEKDTFKTFKKSDLRMFKQLAKEGREPSSSSSLESTFITPATNNVNFNHTYINIMSEEEKKPSSKSLDGTFISRQQQKTNLQSAFNSKLTMGQHLATNNKDKEKENEDFLNKLQTQQSQLNQEEDIRQYNLNANVGNVGKKTTTGLLLNTATFKRIKKPSPSIIQQQTTKGEEDSKEFIGKLEQTFLLQEENQQRKQKFEVNELTFTNDKGKKTIEDLDEEKMIDELCQEIERKTSFSSSFSSPANSTFIGGTRMRTGAGMGREGGGGGGGSEENLQLPQQKLLQQFKFDKNNKSLSTLKLKGAQSNDDLLFDDRETNKSSSSSSMTSFLAREELEALKRKANRSNENLDCTFSCPNAVAQDAYLHQIDINKLSSSNNKKTPTMPLLPNRSKTFKKSSQERPQIVVVKKKTANEEDVVGIMNETNVIIANSAGAVVPATNIDTRTFRRPSSSNNKFLRESQQQQQQQQQQGSIQRRSMNVELKVNDELSACYERSILATSSPVSSNSASSQRMESVPFSPIVKDASLMRRQQLQFNQFHAQESQQQHIKQPINVHYQNSQVLKQQNPIVVPSSTNNVAQQRQMPVPSSHHHHHQLPLQQQQQATTTVTTGIPRLKPRSRLPIPRR